MGAGNRRSASDGRGLVSHAGSALLAQWPNGSG